MDKTAPAEAGGRPPVQYAPWSCPHHAKAGSLDRGAVPEGGTRLQNSSWMEPPQLLPTGSVIPTGNRIGCLSYSLISYMKKEYIRPIEIIILKGIGLEVQKKGMYGKIQKRRRVNQERERWIIEEEGPGGEKTSNPFDRGLMQW